MPKRSTPPGDSGKPAQPEQDPFIQDVRNSIGAAVAVAFLTDRVPTGIEPGGNLAVVYGSLATEFQQLLAMETLPPALEALRNQPNELERQKYYAQWRLADLFREAARTAGNAGGLTVIDFAYDGLMTYINRYRTILPQEAAIARKPSEGRGEKRGPIGDAAKRGD